MVTRARIGWLAGAVLVAAALPAAIPAVLADSATLWRIVDGQCAVHLRQTGDPAPCLALEPGSGPAGGYAVLKDSHGVAQLLVVPTARTSGIDDGKILDPATPNYWRAAWLQRARFNSYLQRELARDEIGLAINSAFGRSQDQLHIHIDCLRPDVREALRRVRDSVGTQWSPLTEPLRGHHYAALRIDGDDLTANNPFLLLAGSMPGARETMAKQTLVLTGAVFADGGQGFILLDDRADPAAGDLGHGEELLDHDCKLAATGR